MKVSRYLIVGATGWSHSYFKYHSCRLSKETPTLKSGEIAIELKIDLPDELFTKPQLSASIKVDPKKVNAPEITADVLDNIKIIMDKQLGIDMTINIIEPEAK